ncbi:helix-turn-helix domain-containing protein [Roseibium sediminis]|uniref:helix-turn-helix domain-containing protein n=1 Tax=Roseibium sediminis TaxID=1775174 RepID=UPI00123C8A6E|nr:helix-turn-helix transcriptional regulator [Roseibium sediminis]
MQTITSPSGETLVVLPLAEYEALIDASDIAEAQKTRAGLASGQEELVPAEVVARLIDAENPIRVWREHRGLSAKALAKAAGISPPYLSELETGKKEGKVSVLKRLAEALSVDLDDLV